MEYSIFLHGSPISRRAAARGEMMAFPINKSFETIRPFFPPLPSPPFPFFLVVPFLPDFARVARRAHFRRVGRIRRDETHVAIVVRDVDAIGTYERLDWVSPYIRTEKGEGGKQRNDSSDV